MSCVNPFQPSRKTPLGTLPHRGAADTRSRTAQGAGHGYRDAVMRVKGKGGRTGVRQLECQQANLTPKEPRAVPGRTTATPQRRHPTPPSAASGPPPLRVAPSPSLKAWSSQHHSGRSVNADAQRVFPSRPRALHASMMPARQSATAHRIMGVVSRR